MPLYPLFLEGIFRYNFLFIKMIEIAVVNCLGVAG